ncbi:MAG TPA: polyribonucleotide nucleotidyltransferase [Bryobacterales bacterium]|jgi:polyribonucleotide nucleotidyltransferase|nr:polyribonucleotide nucleotidyltransferase [Bryobacterales bacterium]
MTQTTQVEVGGRTLTLETGKIAKQANGAVLVRSGDSAVLVTAVAAQEGREGIDFFPLTVDYREYTYAAGRIPGGYIKREGRPSEKEILTSRLIDRPIRPLFPEGFHCETQIIAMVLSADPEFDPSVLSIVGASAALAISDIPFLHVIGAVRVGLVDGELIAVPGYAKLKESKLNIVVAAAEEGIVMVEAAASEVDEAKMIEAINFGHENCKKIVAAIRELAEKVGKPKRKVTPPALDQALYTEIETKFGASLRDALDTAKHPKQESHELVRELKNQVLAGFAEQPEKAAEAKKIFEALQEKIFREDVILRRRRPDARGFDQIRPISCEVAVLPRTHGSALFTRGETQALVTATLGTKEDAQRQELLEEAESFKRFMLHYNFPPFSVGEVGFLRGPGRREIGHGALAERALAPMIPEEEDFPYTVRVVSDILESNGSSSMATVCGATLSLMDAGVPIKAPVAGIAMGLVKEGDKYAVLTDIAGAEDHYGDMDFKVAGTRDGITALQMDIKTPNVSTEILEKALAQARTARLLILDKMLQTIAEPRVKVSPYAPRIYTMNIATSKIRDVIGPGGKVIRAIIEQTGVKIDVNDDGTIHIASSDEASANKAMQMIGDITAVAEVGKTYLGKVVRLVDFGAFVEIFPGTDGLLHISEVAEHRIRDVRDELKEGDQILVKVLALEGNKIKLSRKAVLREQREKKKQMETQAAH